VRFQRSKCFLLFLWVLAFSSSASASEYLSIRSEVTEHQYSFAIVEDRLPFGDIYRVVATAEVADRVKWKELTLFTSLDFIELKEGLLLSNGDFAVSVAARSGVVILIGNLISGLVEANDLAYNGLYLIGETGAPVMIEHKGLLYVAYARLPAGRFEKYEYTQIRYRVRTAPGRWTKERILYSTPNPFNCPVHLQWVDGENALSLSVQAERFENAPDLEVTLSVPESEPGA